MIVSDDRVPSPSAVAGEFFPILFRSPEIAASGGGTSGMLPHLLFSITLTLVGGTAGTLLGIGIGLLMSVSRRARYFLEAPIEAIRVLPPLAAVPFFLIWFGPWPLTQFLVILFYASLRMVVFTHEAVRNINPLYDQYAATLGARPAQRVRGVILPAMLPELVGGIRVMIATAWGIEVVAELMGSQFGVGRLFALLATFLASTAIVTIIIWVSLVGITLDLAFQAISRRLTRWV